MVLCPTDTGWNETCLIVAIYFYRVSQKEVPLALIEKDLNCLLDYVVKKPWGYNTFGWKLQFNGHSLIVASNNSLFNR